MVKNASHANKRKVYIIYFKNLTVFDYYTYDARQHTQQNIRVEIKCTTKGTLNMQL